jgi:hypothetical protein
MISQLTLAGVALVLLTIPAQLSQKFLINPTLFNLEHNLAVLPIDQISNQPMLLTSYHDRYGNWYWDDNNIEFCYNWSAGYPKC